MVPAGLTFPPYVYQEYPKAKYHGSGAVVTVQTAEDERALGAGWYDHPDACAPVAAADLADESLSDGDPDAAPSKRRGRKSNLAD